ncbi:hypothetical protein D3C76_1372250 [compost metagenome]
MVNASQPLHFLITSAKAATMMTDGVTPKRCPCALIFDHSLSLTTYPRELNLTSVFGSIVDTCGRVAAGGSVGSRFIQ